jgi:hypothetical protein
MELAVPYKCIRKSKYPCWYSSTLKYYIKKNTYFRRYKKNKSDMYYLYFALCRKLVKATIKSDRQQWLKF